MLLCVLEKQGMPRSPGSRGGWEKVLKIGRPVAEGFLGLTGPWGPKVVDCPVEK